MTNFPRPEQWVQAVLQQGIVIPAHPLALTPKRKLDERRQRALTRYYHAAGVGGIAVGVHTTQFAIREKKHGLLKPVLQLCADTVGACERREARRIVRIAGVCGLLDQAIAEAQLARELGYHAALLSLAALKNDNEDGLITHCERVAMEMPLFGFYLQPQVGGRVLPFRFWRRFVEIPNVVAIKIAPFNRYQTLDVIRAVAESGRANDIALYTGNDDNIVVDLLTTFRFASKARDSRLCIAGGLLGHWACWTRKAVELLDECKRCRIIEHIPATLLQCAAQVTDTNAAFFDAPNRFAGCIAGIHEVLRRQGLLEGTWCLDENESLSPGQAEEVERVWRSYPHLNDDDFVKQHLDEWLTN